MIRKKFFCLTPKARKGKNKNSFRLFFSGIIFFSAATLFTNNAMAQSLGLSLESHEIEALSMIKNWKNNRKTVKPVMGSDGSIQFIYGHGQTSIVCAVMQVCDIALQMGEKVNNLNIGDPRFLIEPAMTGEDEQIRMHLLVKPQDPALDTSLVVTTNFRTYHFRLRSSEREFMPYISFVYPDEQRVKWQMVAQEKARERHENTLPETGEYLGDLHFNYEIRGKSRWKPVRVYTNGIKTIIEMPHYVAQGEVPTLLILRHEAGFLKSEETEIINYRFQGNRYIVDGVFDKALLVAGVGSKQERIIIKRKA